MEQPIDISDLDQGLDRDQLKKLKKRFLAISEERLARTRALAGKLRIEGTPTFVIGDQVVRGYVPLKELQAKVKEARQG